jgi:DNA-binding NarL/FixJ family response regulator
MHRCAEENICNVKGGYKVDEITVLLIDDNPKVKTRICSAISQQPDLTVLEYDPSQDIMTTIDSSLPDVALISTNPSGPGGCELAGDIARRYPDTRVIMLSPDPNDEELFEAAKTAAAAYLNRNVPAERLISIIRQVQRGDYPINDSVLARPDLAKLILRYFKEISSRNKGMDRMAAPLSNLENQILVCVTSCVPDTMIARTLRVSDRTVRNQVSAILRKLIAYDRAQKVARNMQAERSEVG